MCLSSDRDLVFLHTTQSLSEVSTENIYDLNKKMGHQQRSYILYVLALALISILGQFLVPNFIFIMLKLSVKVSVQGSQFLIVAG